MVKSFCFKLKRAYRETEKNSFLEPEKVVKQKERGNQTFSFVHIIEAAAHWAGEEAFERC